MTDSAPADPDLDTAIASHLATTGPAGWGGVREQFPEVSDSTFWRRVRKVRAGEVARPSAAQARRQLAAHVNASVTNVPLRLSAELAQLFSDVELLRAYSLKDGAIKNPHLFLQAVVLRDKAIQTAMRARQSILDGEDAEAFFSAVVDEVAAVDVETSRRIMTRLAVFRNQGQGAAGPPGPP